MNKKKKTSRTRPAAWKARVENATVRLTSNGCLGVLVPGGFVLTATHGISCEFTGNMTLGKHYLEPIKTKTGRSFDLEPYSADPLSDIAVLGDLDSQDREEYEFEEWCETTAPVLVRSSVPEIGETVRVHILTHLGKWLTGTITRFGLPGRLPGGRLMVKADQPIESGTSGGPIVDDTGQLVGVVSWSPTVKPGEKCMGAFPVACLALPGWVWAQICQSTK